MSTPFPNGELLKLLGLGPDAGFSELRDRMIDGLPGFSTRYLDSIRKGALSKRIASVAATSRVALSVHQWGVWPSGELPELFQLIRASQGMSESPWECSGELVDPDEADYLLCLVATCLFNCWDFSVVRLDGTVVVYATHDDELFIGQPDPRGDSLLEEIREFGLETLQ